MSDLLLTPDPRPLGKSGISVGPIAWGMWRFGNSTPAQGRRLIEAAFAAGVTLFDTADIYGFDGSPEKARGGFGAAETLLGQVIGEAPALRSRMVLATKGGITPPVPYDSSRDYLMRALDDSLRRMRVENVDLFQVHRPDILTHPQEVARTLENMVSSGKVRSVGVSNFTRHQTTALASFVSVPLASMQPELSPLEISVIEGGLADLAMERDYAVLAWSPLGGGRIGTPTTSREEAVAAGLDAVATKHGVGRAATAYSWIMAHPMRAIPIVGTQDEARIGDLADAFKIAWSRREWYDVLVAARGEKLP